MKATSKFLVDFGKRWGLVPYSLDMDTLNTLFIGWVVFSIFVIVLVKFLYSKYIGDSGDESAEYQNHIDASDTEKSSTHEPPFNRRKATIIPDRFPCAVRPPIATGGDPDAVRWINNVLVWLYEGHEGGKIIKETWNDYLNEVTVSSALETGVLIEVLEVLPETEPPTCRNIVVDCDLNDNITITCDIDLTAYLRVQSTRTQKDLTTESEYACSITPLRGRLTADIETYECSIIMQLVGWPEVVMDTEGIRNNSTGLDEIQLQQVLREVLVGALRTAVLHLNFAEYSSFPRFKRARDAPDPVIPVGYDSLVREAQTHPPSLTRPSSYIKPIHPSLHSKLPKFQVSAATSIKTDSIELQGDKSAEISQNSLAFSSTFIPNQSNQTSTTFLKPTDNLNLNDSASDEDIIEEAGESFTSMCLPSHATDISDLSSNGNKTVKQEYCALTDNEESLVARINAQYDSESKMEREDITDLHSKIYTPPISCVERKSRNEDVQRKNISPKQRTRSRSPVRRSVPRESICRSSNLNSIDPNVYNNDEELSGRSSPLQLSWKNYVGQISDEEDDPECLKEILQQTSSLIGRSSSFNMSNKNGMVGLSGKKLLVKVVKMSDVDINKAVNGLYVDVEIDEPYQKYTTTVIPNSTLSWNQQFVFDMNDHTLELLFEVFESSERQFLGLGIVGIEELIATPSQRQVIALQARPYEKDDVSGSLICEFLFLDKSGLTDVSQLTSSSTKQLNGSTVKTTTTIYAKESNHIADDMDEYQDVAEAAIKDLELRNHTNNTQTKSTLIIHASRKPSENSDDDYYNRPPIKVIRSPSPMTATFPPPPISKRSKQGNSTKIDTGTDPDNENSERGRSRDKKLNFFGTLRKRFGRSKDRSRSMEPNVQSRDSSSTRNTTAGRSISVERKKRDEGLKKTSTEESTEQTSQNEESRKGFLTVPRFRMHSRTPEDTGSARSSISGLSGLSSASTRTYFNEDSLLVVETREKSDLKYYLVPIAIQKEGKFKKRGKKMHIYNEHRFVAKHLTSSTLCEVCDTTVGRSLGKQAYKCRDCGFISHKPCHVQVATTCPNSKVNSMDITYVRNKRQQFRSSELDKKSP